MPLDFVSHAPQEAGFPAGRALRGAQNYATGQSGEACAMRDYAARGYEIIEHRWRGKAGEIDFICQKYAAFIFVEVKTSKTHARAAESLSARQLSRICLASVEYCGLHGAGLLQDMRLDLATVDGQGRVEVRENLSL